MKFEYQIALQYIVAIALSFFPLRYFIRIWLGEGNSIGKLLGATFYTSSLVFVFSALALALLTDPGELDHIQLAVVICLPFVLLMQSGVSIVVSKFLEMLFRRESDSTIFRYVAGALSIAAIITATFFN